MGTFWKKVIDFIGPASNAIKGYVNLNEIFRIITTGVLAGSSMSAIFSAIEGSLGKIITDPVLLNDLMKIITETNAKNYTALIFAVLTMVLELYRRINQGTSVDVVKK